MWHTKNNSIKATEHKLLNKLFLAIIDKTDTEVLEENSPYSVAKADWP